MKRTIVLLLITLAVAAWVYWMEVREGTRLRDTDQRQQAARTLTGVTSREISSFTLRPVDREAITARNVEGDWVLTRPVSTRAEDASVKRVLWDLEWTEKERTIEASALTDERLSDYGLLAPRGAIEVETTLPDMITLVVGGQAPGGQGVYVREGDDGPVHLVAANFARNLDLTVEQMRSKTIVDLAPGQMGSIKIHSEDVKAALARRQGKWNLTEPFEDHADPEVVNRFLNNAAQLKVSTFVSEAPESYEEYGLVHPESPHTVEEGTYIVIGEALGGGGRERIVHFGDVAPNGEIYAIVKGESTLFTLPAGQVAQLFVRLSDLQARRVVRVDPYALTRVTMSHGLEQVEFARRDFDWHVVKPFEAQAHNRAVADLLNYFESARILEHITPEPVLDRYGLDVPRGSFSFVEGTALPQGIIFGGEAPGGAVYAKRTDTPGVFTVSASLFDRLSRRPLDYHTRDMQKVSMDRARSVTIKRADGEFVIAPLRPAARPADWRMREPATAPVNPRVVERIILGLATTTAVDLVEKHPRDLAAYGLHEPEIKVSANLSDTPDQPRAILVGRPAEGGGRYAMLEGGDLVFTIAGEFATALRRELKEPRVLDFARTAAGRVEFVKGDIEYVAVKVDGRWMVESPEGFGVASAAIEDELLHLSRLETEKFETYTTGRLADYGLVRPQAVVRIETPQEVAAISVGDMHPRGLYYATSTTVDGVFLLDPGDLINILEPGRLFEEPAG